MNILRYALDGQKNEMRDGLFCNTDPYTLDSETDARCVIEKILEYGYKGEVCWAWHRYGKDRIRSVAVGSKTLTPKSRNFWLLMTQN